MPIQCAGPTRETVDLVVDLWIVDYRFRKICEQVSGIINSPANDWYVPKNEVAFNI